MEDKSTKNKKPEKINIPEAYLGDVAKWRRKFKKVKYLCVAEEKELKLKAEDSKDDKESEMVEIAFERKFVFFRQPNRIEMSAAENMAIDENEKFDVFKKAEKIMVDCYLGGDYTLDEILNDIELYMSTANFCLYRLVEAKNVNWGSC